MSGPLPAGCPKEGPYDLIFVQGAVEFVPAQLWEQLKDDGRLACILGGGPGSDAMIYSAMNGNLAGHPVFQAGATLLPGFAKPREFVF